jgi:hypothetical protein
MPQKSIGMRSYGGDSEDNLILKVTAPGWVDVMYEPSPEKLEMATQVLNEPPAEVCKKLLEIGNSDGRFLSMYPLNTIPTHRDFLHPKYKQVESISLDQWHFKAPETKDDLLAQLEELPAGFVKDASYGLGLQKDYRFIIEAIEKIPDIKHLVISWKRQTGIDEEFYYLSFRDFDSLRRAMNRITTSKQTDGNREKVDLAHNSLLTALSPDKFPETKRPYKPDTIFKLIGDNANEQSWSRADRSAAVRVVEQSKRSLAKESPSQLLQLRNDIELVTLEALITKFEEMLGRNLQEGQWQRLFNENPFILNLAFGYPVTKIRDQAHVGGQTLSGSGATITDFLVKNGINNNIALFEIKTPQSSLLSKTPYRNLLYSPASDLVGAISQMLDQKYELQKSIATIKDNSKIHDIESYAVHGVLIIGTTPEGPDRQKSFELFRANSKDVSVFTFDELLSKLKLILRFLSERSPEAQQNSKLIDLETRLLRLQKELPSAFDASDSTSNGIRQITLAHKPGVDGKKIDELFAKSGILKTGFEQARLRHPPYPLHFDESGNRAVVAETVDDFLRKAEILISEAEASFNEAFPTSRGGRLRSRS